MRTVDPDSWYKRSKGKPLSTKREIFGPHSASPFETRLRSSFRDALKDFWANSSLEGVKYTRNKSAPIAVRRCYIVFILALTLFGLIANWQDWCLYRAKPPLVINLHSTQHPVQYVDFPAVGICSYNVISKMALKEYASYLYSLDENGTYTLEAIEKNLLTFGALMTWSNPPVDVTFMEYLAKVAHETNVTNIIIKLAPKCSSFLLQCGWRSARVPCDRLLALRPTPHGYCCVFNSRYIPEDRKNPAKKLNLVGEDSGLALVIRDNESDVAYIRRPGEGVEVIRTIFHQSALEQRGRVCSRPLLVVGSRSIYSSRLSPIVERDLAQQGAINRVVAKCDLSKHTVLLFDGSDYPLIEGGSSKVYLTERNVSAFFKLSVTAQYIASGLHRYGEEWRGCRIRDAQSKDVDRRSQAWCLVGCGRRAVLALCGCVPHMLLPRPGDTVCSPDQLACLNKHKEKFSYYYPGDSAHPSLNEESSDSLECEHCGPDCDRFTYSAAVSHAQYQFTRKLFLNLFSKGAQSAGITFINTTVIRIFYASEDQRMYIVESNLHWFEFVAVIGSRWLCLVAVTTVSLAEFIYFVTIRWGYHYIRRKRLEGRRKLKTTTSIGE